MMNSLLPAIDFFLLRLSTEKGLARKVLEEDYKSALYNLCEFIDQCGLHEWGELRYYHLKYYKNYLLGERDMSSFSCSLKIRHIKNFFRFLYEEKLIEKGVNVG